MRRSVPTAMAYRAAVRWSERAVREETKEIGDREKGVWHSLRCVRIPARADLALFRQDSGHTPHSRARRGTRRSSRPAMLNARRPHAAPEGAGARQRGPMGVELRREGRVLASRRANERRASGAARNRRLRPSAAGGLGPAAGRAMEERGAEPEQRRFTWEEIAQRTGRGPAADERWLVIDRKVYDISRFHRRHPGGSRVISHYAGQDATVRGRGAGQGRGVSAARMGSGHGAVRGFPLLPLSCALRKEMPLFSARKEEKKRGETKTQTNKRRREQRCAGRCGGAQGAGEEGRPSPRSALLAPPRSAPRC